MNQLNILLVDDHQILSDGLSSILSSEPHLRIIAKVSSGSYALAHLKAEKVDLMITDYSMPDMNGGELVREAKKIAPALKVIVLTMHDELPIVQEMVAAGIDAYILKKYAQQELLLAISALRENGSFWSKEISRLLVSGFSGNSEVQELTSRELEILRLLGEELTSKEISERLFISERTVETHRKNLLRKTNSSSTVGLIKYAYARKLL